MKNQVAFLYECINSFLFSVMCFDCTLYAITCHCCLSFMFFKFCFNCLIVYMCAQFAVESYREFPIAVYTGEAL